MLAKPTILLIYTGGTIGMVKDYATGALKAFNFSQIVKNIPELKQLDCHISAISFDEPIDSSNMNTDYYIQIAQMIAENYSNYDGFVILTGSDTMAYTASTISFMLENLQKPIIFTGSQLPIGDLRTDAKENLITAIEIASLKDENDIPIIKEVGLYFEYKLYRANRTTKINAEHFEAFKSLNYPSLIESGVHLRVNYNALRTPISSQSLRLNYNLDNNIVILKLFPNIQPNIVESILNIDTLKGVVLETYGAGNAPTAKWFIDLLKQAIDKGIYIVNVTQCLGGNVIMGHYETSNTLKNIGVISGKDITTESAVAKMMYLLGKKLPKDQFKILFESNLRGEMS